MTRTLDAAVRAGEPLIDIVAQFKDGVNYAIATDVANSFGKDIELDEADWNGLPKLRIGQVTAEGALRHFGVSLPLVFLTR